MKKISKKAVGKMKKPMAVQTPRQNQMPPMGAPGPAPGGMPFGMRKGGKAGKRGC